MARGAALLVLAAALSACGDLFSVPTLGQASPGEVRPGETLRVEGEHLDLALGIRFSGKAPRTVTWSEVSPGAGAVEVPVDLPSGWYDLAARSAGWRAPVGAARVEVWRPDTEAPCHKRYALRVETERLLRRVAVDRVLPDGSDEHFAFFGEELRAVEREVLVLPTPCTALWLHVADGRRILLADDPTAELLVEASALAEALELPLRGGAALPEPTESEALPSLPKGTGGELVGE